MKNALTPRTDVPRPTSLSAPRPRPTAAAALLLAIGLSLPFALVALGQFAFQALN
ncbi:MAG: hypothetical protein QNJ09_06500 [Paracoccaceae bacterium]|nr:hypothetical protein [Paracoccaceae bacterium]